MLKIKLQMAKEAEDPAFDRSDWEVEDWKQRLEELGDEDEPEEVLALESGGGAKDPEAEAAGGSGKGGEEEVQDAAKVWAAQMGNDENF
ncbi:hypothetical protein Hanom_Chr02g00147131 [Helianthus anomalus]